MSLENWMQDPLFWPAAKVRAYLGFPPENEDLTSAFTEFSVDLLLTGRGSDNFFAGQFAAGSIVPGVRALWYQWPNDSWEDFEAWLAGTTPETSSSRRDFLMAGGDYMRVWRELYALKEACAAAEAGG